MLALGSTLRTQALRLVALAAVLLILAAATPGVLARPSRGSESIYYIGPWASATSGGSAVMTTINPDGSNRTQLGLGMWGPPSPARHNNYCWFVSTRPVPNSFYPDGSPRSEVFVYRQDYDFQLNNNNQTLVQLTDDVTLQPAPSSSDWVPDGLQISFKGRRWSSAAPGATIMECGIYTATLAFGVDGNIIGLLAQPSTPAVDFPIGGDSWPSFPSFGGYGWHPTSDRVVYVGTPGLWVANLLTGTRTQIYSGSAMHPQYAPDGTKIAFTNGSLGISTIKVNGTGLKQIIRATNQRTFVRPFWSPSGTQLVCTGQTRSGALTMDVYRANANGNALTNLTNTPHPFDEWPWGWR
jgi:hypothetical protein